MSRFTALFALFITLLGWFATPRSAAATAYTWAGPTSSNWTTAGAWTPGGGPPGTGVGDTGAINSLTAVANAQLGNNANITVGGTGILSINALATSATGGTITVNNRIEYVGATTGTTNISFQTGSNFGKLALNALTTTKDSISVTGTVTANNLQATTNASGQGLQFLGSFSGSGTLVVDGSGTGNRLGALTLAPTSANAFNGTVNLSGTSGVYGTLALSGTGALRNVTSLNLNNLGDLKLINATDPLPASSTITVNNGARIDWSGTQTYTTLADRPTITLNNGASFGRMNENLNAGNSVSETINIASGATVTASRINSSNGVATAALSLVGSLTGASNTTLVVDPVGTGNDFGPLRIAPTTANSSFLGNVVLQSSTSQFGTLILGGTGALSNINSLTIANKGQLRLQNATNPFTTAGFLIDVGTGGRLEWDGAQTYTGTAPTVLLRNGSFIGKTDSLNAGATQNEAITFDSGATVQAANITGTDSFTSAALTLAGSITGASNTTLKIQPTLGGNNWAPLRIAPASANTSFSGAVVLDGGTGGAAGLPGALVLGGTGALSGITSLTINSGGLFRLAGATDPLPSGFSIVVGSGARMEWEGTQTYTVTPPTVTLQNGSFFGRKLAAASAATEAITVAPGATVTVNQLGGTSPGGNTAFFLQLSGPLSGSVNSKIVLTHTGVANQWGVLQLSGSTPNPYLGTVEVTGFNASNQGMLNLTGTGSLANAALLDVKQFGSVLVSNVGGASAADGVDEIRVESGGVLRFRDNTSSLLGQTVLTGVGLVRSETVSTSPTTNTTLRPLSLNNMSLSPGFSAGTLTIEASSLTLGTNAKYIAQLGTLSDLLQVQGTGGGNLILTSGSILQLDSLAGLGVGTYVIANYTGTLTGTFGSIITNLTDPYAFASINYGSLTNSQITVMITQLPEPNSGLMLLGCAILGMLNRRRKLKS